MDLNESGMECIGLDIWLDFLGHGLEFGLGKAWVGLDVDLIALNITVYGPDKHIRKAYKKKSSSLS